MPRRVTVPDDLFRPTAVPQADPVVDLAGAKEARDAKLPKQAEAKQPVAAEPEKPAKGRTSSGRVKHDEKMTVYVTSDELLDLEHARLELRRHHALGVDRGRIVRAAIAMALADLDEHGADSALVARLAQD